VEDSLNFNRRNVLKISGLAALVAPFGGFSAGPARAQSEPLFRFGVIADPQYAAAVPNLELDRYYSNSLSKLSEAITTLNKEDLKFVVTLGDLIDRDWESYAHVLPLYDQLKHDHFVLLGNHDYAVAPEYMNSILRTTGLKSAHYDFAGGGYRFIVVDGNDVSLFAPPPGDPRRDLAQRRLDELKAKDAVNAQPWNGSMSDEQYAWLAQTIAKAETAGEKIIVLGHYPIFPDFVDNAMDSARLVDVLTKSKNVVAYFCGHHHPGNYGETGGKHFVNFKGMVDTPATNAFAIVEVYGERIEIRGFGREPNRTLKLGA
jgi:3',5'-cyclic AMP phosphodiesterase CpdA